jgi:hypothetical protein
LQPGIQRVRVRLRVGERQGQISSTLLHHHANAPQEDHPLVDEATGLPSSVFLRAILDAFFENIAQFHPSIQRNWVEESLASGTMSAFLALSIAAVTSPFVAPGQLPSDAGDRFFDRCKEMTVELISFPSIEVCEALLLLAWCAFARNQDGLCWVHPHFGRPRDRAYECSNTLVWGRGWLST